MYDHRPLSLLVVDSLEVVGDLQQRELQVIVQRKC